MSKPMRRSAALVASAALALSLSGCVASAWEYESPPAAGSQTDLAGLKLRNFMIIADEAGEAMLVGAITARDEADSVTAMAYAPETSDGSFGTVQELAFAHDIRKGETIYLDGTAIQFSDPQLLVGRLARLQVAFDSGNIAQLDIPVMSSTHRDFVQAWEEAH